MTQRFLSSLLLSCTALAGCAADTTADVSPDTSASEAVTFDTAAMDELLSSAVEAGDVIGVSALVYDEDRVVYEGEFGLGDRERNVPVADDTVWRIYSMTKPMTSVLIMDLVEEGRIDLSDPVSKYLPEIGDMKVATVGENGMELVDPSRDMTIEDLLLHTAGFGYGIFGPINPVEIAYVEADLFNPAEPLEAKMIKLSQLPLIGNPGDQWFYSISIDVLGRIIEIVTEQTLAEAFDERLFTPLGMDETGFYVRPDQAARFVSNYAVQQDGSFVLAEDAQSSPFLNNNDFQSGGGGLVSTRGDVAKFAEMMLNGGEYEGTRILEEDTVALMMSAQSDPDIPYLLPWLGGETGALFGYGGSVQVTATPEQQAQAGKYPGQWGWGGAARTNFYVDPQNDAFGIIMLQFFSPQDPEIHATFQALALEETRDDRD